MLQVKKFDTKKEIIGETEARLKIKTQNAECFGLNESLLKES